MKSAVVYSTEYSLANFLAKKILRSYKHHLGESTYFTNVSFLRVHRSVRKFGEFVGNRWPYCGLKLASHALND